MGRARGRTWTFEALDREHEYLLWFDRRARRWEIRPVGQDVGTVVNRRPPEERRRGTEAQRSEPPDGGTGPRRPPGRAGSAELPAAVVRLVHPGDTGPA